MRVQVRSIVERLSGASVRPNGSLALPRQQKYDHKILQAVASGQRVTQRSLSGELGVALGLTNLLIRRLISRGYLKMSRIGTRQVRYLMTAAGWEALGRATRLSLENTVRLYTDTREQIRQTLAEVSQSCARDEAGRKNIVFYGAGDVAEIAYVSLQRTDLTLVAVVDDRRRGRFFGMEIYDSRHLACDSVNGVPYAHVIVTTIRHSAAITQRMQQCGIPTSRVTHLTRFPNSCRWLTD
jgi:DNA-binding MarR family transcriptional regulator